MLKKIKEKIWIISIATFLFAVGGWVTFVQIGFADGQKNDSKQDDAIEKLVENQQQLAIITKSINSKLDVILQFVGVKVTDSLINKWIKMPRKIPCDSLGNHISGSEWLSISDDYRYARTFKWVNNDSILVKIEWDERKPK